LILDFRLSPDDLRALGVTGEYSSQPNLDQFKRSELAALELCFETSTLHYLILGKLIIPQAADIFSPTNIFKSPKKPILSIISP
jgi:hypothetical protein